MFKLSMWFEIKNGLSWIWKKNGLHWFKFSRWFAKLRNWGNTIWKCKHGNLWPDPFLALHLKVWWNTIWKCKCGNLWFDPFLRALHLKAWGNTICHRFWRVCNTRKILYSASPVHVDVLRRLAIPGDQSGGAGPSCSVAPHNCTKVL